jgi:ribonuclease BN (tRNA processing enzyme)
MRITFTGTGNCMLDPSRSMPGIALETAGGVYLVDPGSGTIHACLQAGITPGDMAGVFLTHFHVDHTLDLAQLLWLRHVHRKRMTRPLLAAGPRGTKEFISGLDRAFGLSLDEAGAALAIAEMEPGSLLEEPGLAVRAFRSLHTDVSLCLRFETEGRCVACSGDSGLSGGLIEACRDADLAVLECSYDASPPVATHMGPEQCGRAAAAAGAARVVLTHLPAGIDPEALAAAVAGHYDGPCTVAVDFMHIDL